MADDAPTGAHAVTEAAKPRRRIFNRRRWEPYAIAAFVLLILGVFVLGPVWLDFKMRRAADEFGTPSSMRLLDRASAGDFLCVITCLGKTTALVFQTTESADESCRILRRHIEREGYKIEPLPSYLAVPAGARCSFYAPAPRVRDNATLRASLVPAGSVSGYLAPGDVSTDSVAYDELVVSVLIAANNG